jgi:hypothetical protein
MLTIREEQLAAFSRVKVKAFEDRVFEHLLKFFPKQLKALGDERARETIQYGIGRAANYGIRGERDVCKYIDLMIVFGRDFDRDPNLPQARTTLNDKTLKSSGARINRLYDEATGSFGRQA